MHEDHQARAGGRLFFNIQPGKHEAREVDETERRDVEGEGRGGGDSSEGAGHSAILGRVYKCRGAFIGRVSMLCIRAEHTGQEKAEKRFCSIREAVEGCCCIRAPANVSYYSVCSGYAEK